MYIESANLLSGVVGAIATTLLLAIGFLFRRWITGAEAQEKVTLYQSLADLQSRMKEHGFSLDEVRALDALLRSKARQTAALGRKEEPSGPQHYWTQTAMNFRAAASANTADARLSEALTNLQLLISNEQERKGLKEVNAIWSKYRDAQSEFSAMQYMGGSIMPLIRASEFESLTLERLKSVTADVEERKSR